MRYSYAGLMKRLKKALPKTAEMTLIGNLSAINKKYPVVKIIMGHGNPKRALIAAGIHGNEPAGVHALFTFLKKKHYRRFSTEWELTFLPCINPSGYELGTRENYENIDLNRKFRTKSPPPEVKFVKTVFKKHYDITLELHEDVDSPGYYLYQALDSKKRTILGHQILERVKDIIPINTSSEIEEMEAEGGVIKASVDPKKMKWWPMAIYSMAKGADYFLTLETPTKFPMKTRVAAHLAAIDSALANFKRKRR